MNKAKKSVLAFVAVLSLAFIMGATMDSPNFGMSDGQASSSMIFDDMRLAADSEDGGSCC